MEYHSELSGVMDERVLSFEQRDPGIPNINITSSGTRHVIILGAQHISIGVHSICDPHSTSHDNPVASVDSSCTNGKYTEISHCPWTRACR